MTATRVDPVSSAIGYGLYDADQHYYEAGDALTRHLDRTHRHAVRWIDMDGRRTLIINDRLLKMIPNPTYDPVGRPGSMGEYFRAKNQDGRSLKEILGEMQPMQAEYRDRAARVEVLDEQGVEFTWMLPSLGLGLEEMLHDNLDALGAVVRAYNEWLADDWGYDRDGRIQTAPLVCLGNPEAAEAELARVLALGARLVVLRPAPVASIAGPRSLGDPVHDRIWAMAADAGIVVAFHAADSGYGKYLTDWGESPYFQGWKSSPLSEILSIHSARPIFDTMAAMISHGVFDRHPTLRVATVELGAGWVPYLFDRMAIAYGKTPQHFGRDPIEAFREHVWVTPFYEDDIADLADLIGTDHVLFGSDWPHPEGIAAPGDYAADVATLPAATRRMIMRDNLRTLVGR